MSITYGFYNAVNQNGVWDREYTAEQLSAIFDGLINDGVYESVGSRFAVTVTDPASWTVIVGSGRAWFEHTWTLNDAPIQVTFAEADATLDRIDAICIHVDSSTRENSIIVISGPSAATPVKPNPTNSTMTSHDYPIAYVKIIHQHTIINQTEIENAVGTSVCPFVTGLVQVYSIDQLVAQWQALWNVWLENRGDEFTALETNTQTRIDYLDTEIYDIEQQVGADLKPIVGYDITVPINAWVTFEPESGTEEYKIKDKGYEYRALIPLANVLPGMRPYITWSLPELEDSGADILNQFQCTSGGVYAYSTGAPSEPITALTVECRKTVV